MVKSPKMQTPRLKFPVIESPIKLSPTTHSPMMACMTPPPSRLQPMCVTPHIQVPTNTPTIAGLTTSTKGAQSQLLQEAASKLEDRSLAEMGSKQTYLKAVDEKVIPNGNNTWMDVKVRNHKLHTVDRRGRVEVETEDGGLTRDMEEA